MTITIGTWIFPLIITMGLLGAMFRPYQSSGDYDFGATLRILWLIPILVVWVMYLALALWLR